MKGTMNAQMMLANAEVSILHKKPLCLLTSFSIASLEGDHDEGFWGVRPVFPLI